MPNLVLYGIRLLAQTSLLIGEALDLDIPRPIRVDYTDTDRFLEKL